MQAPMKNPRIHTSIVNPIYEKKADMSERITMLNPIETETSSISLTSLNLKKKTQHNPGKNNDRSVKKRDNKAI